MVGVINPENATSIGMQAAKALESDSIMLQPGESFPSEEMSSSAALIATATLTTTLLVPFATNGSIATSSTTGFVSASTTSEANPMKQSSGHRLSVGVITGISITAAAILFLLGIALWYKGYCRTPKRELDQFQRQQQGSKRPAHESQASTDSSPIEPWGESCSSTYVQTPCTVRTEVEYVYGNTIDRL